MNILQNRFDANYKLRIRNFEDVADSLIYEFISASDELGGPWRKDMSFNCCLFISDENLKTRSNNFEMLDLFSTHTEAITYQVLAENWVKWFKLKFNLHLLNYLYLVTLSGRIVVYLQLNNTHFEALKRYFVEEYEPSAGVWSYERLNDFFLFHAINIFSETALYRYIPDSILLTYYLSYNGYSQTRSYSPYFLRWYFLKYQLYRYGFTAFRTKVSFEYKVVNGAFSADVYGGWADALCYMFNKYWGVNSSLDLSIFYIVRRVNNSIIADFYFKHEDDARFEAFLLAFSQARVGIFFDLTESDASMQLRSNVICRGMQEANDFNVDSVRWKGNIIAYSLQHCTRKFFAFSYTLKAKLWSLNKPSHPYHSFSSSWGRAFEAKLLNYLDDLNVCAIDWSDLTRVHRVLINTE